MRVRQSFAFPAQSEICPAGRQPASSRRRSVLWRTTFIALLSLVLCSEAVPSLAADQADPLQLFRAGKYAECVTAAQASLEERNLQEQIWVVKLRAELELGRYADAATTYLTAVNLFPVSVKLRWLGRDVLRMTQHAIQVRDLDREIEQLFKDSPWIYADPANQTVMGRWMLTQGADAKKVLTTVYNDVKRRQPQLADVWLAIGDMALDKHDDQLAAESFQRATKLDSDNPDAFFGLARSYASGDPDKAEAALQAALKLNPRHVPSLLLVVDAHIDAERYDDALQVLSQISKINPQQPQSLAYRAVIAHLQNQSKQEKKYRMAALVPWPENPHVDYLLGRKLSQKYRFAEGAEYQRQALKFDPQFLPAKIQLAQDLLRLGDEAAGLSLAEEVYRADGYNIFAHNLVTLQESLTKFRTLEVEGLIVRMEPREAEVYGAQVVALLQRARTELCRKYEVKLDHPVIVELFPQQQDFAIRTFGLPGGAGFLGVCFGTVITANSPASQASHASNWEATLWHEFCHVVTLTKTRNRMPRWLSEGISVHEERLADPTWGQSIDPKFREMILGDDLTPVSRLSGAFLKPKSGAHLQFAYLESSMVVEYIVAEHGQPALQQILVDLHNGLAINEALTRVTGSLDELDVKFAEYAREQARAMAPEANWSVKELPQRATTEELTAWLETHPHNYPALQRLAEQQLAAKDWSAAKATLDEMRLLYPNDHRPGSPLALLARIARQSKDLEAEKAALEKLAALSANQVDAFERLCELAAQAGDWQAVWKYAERLLAVNPMLPATQRRRAEAAEHLGDYAAALEAYRALLQLDPFDVSEIHYRLAVCLKRLGDPEMAKRHVLLSLSETPRYRAAQTLLLELIPPAETAAPQPSLPDPTP